MSSSSSEVHLANC